MAGLKTAVLLIAYRRPDLTQRVLDRLEQVAPERLYVALDGPASIEVTADCRAVKKLIEQFRLPHGVVNLDVAPHNLGCAERVRTALDWVFQHEDQALILEDDTLPGLGWFSWAEHMLDRYRDDEAVGMVSARNPLLRWPANGVGHVRSRFSLIWGWGTWRNRWKAHRESPEANPDAVKQQWIDEPEIGAFRAFLAASNAGKILDTWDVGWAVWQESKNLCNIVPASNWVENLGFDARGTHLTIADDLRSSLPCRAPKEPDLLRECQDFDRLCILNELMCNGAIQNPRKWALLARNSQGVKLPGAGEAWTALLMPFRKSDQTLFLLNHLIQQWGNDAPLQLFDMKQILTR